jgi:hypothetical protein
MCTVSYIPVGKSVFITSNRDEHSGRAPALYPAVYAGNSGKLLYPKDAQAGGSWFAINERGDILVLLNGAFIRHVPQPPYRKSRGVVLLELTDSKSPSRSFYFMDLDGIEPFTLILLEDALLHECRWDGMRKHHGQSAPDQPHIWSSATLYEPGVSQKRRQWFEQWLLANPCPDQDDILRFHQFAGVGDQQNDLVMNRDNLLLTVSITAVCYRMDEVLMRYVDMAGRRETEKTLLLTKPVLL